MATVKIEKFGGIAPRQHPTQLADGMATVAMNVKLDNGKLVPLREPAMVEDASINLEPGLAKIENAKSMHIWRGANGSSFRFLLFPGMTWAAPGNVADDSLTRLLVSGWRTGGASPNEPVLYMRNNGKTESVPIRKSASNHVTVCRWNGSAKVYDAPTSGNIRYARFVISWVDVYGMESPVSNVSKILKAANVQSDEELAYLDGEEIHFEFYGIAHKIPQEADKVRIYKTVAGTTEGRIQQVIDIERSQATANGGFVIGVSDADLGESMPEIENAPADLICVQAVPGSFYCGFAPSKSKTICFSDVDLIYSWPAQYRYDIADNIVALAVTSNSVFALTDGWPYVLSGTAPESMTVAKLASPAACISQRAVCVYKNTVFYASNIGLMAIANSATEGTVVQNITEQLLTKDQWRTLKPETSLVGYDNGRLFLYFPDSELKIDAAPLMDGADLRKILVTGLLFNFAEGLSVALTQHDEPIRCLCVDNATDKAYFVRDSNIDEEEV